jgi:C4-dicarboxylate-specific signal transduction histidine kinase
MTHIALLRNELESACAPNQRIALENRIAAFTDAMERFGRIVEFDPGDAYFVARRISLPDWLRSFNDDYARRHGMVHMDLVLPAEGVHIYANDHLLSTIFWNVWINAQQAVESDCWIKLLFTITGQVVTILALDDGPGLNESSAADAFRNYRPESRLHRGRGLLEVNEALGRLHGTGSLVRQDSGTYRIQLTFPRDVR